ncbi:MAG TPA: hypothetical protein VHZ97_11805 [Pseudonocardiaceae bacterium]|nr:hypothetical protein [Pseudonocardiaceae bacterium]
MDSVIRWSVQVFPSDAILSRTMARPKVPRASRDGGLSMPATSMPSGRTSLTSPSLRPSSANLDEILMMCPACAEQLVSYCARHEWLGRDIGTPIDRGVDALLADNPGQLGELYDERGTAFLAALADAIEAENGPPGSGHVGRDGRSAARRRLRLEAPGAQPMLSSPRRWAWRCRSYSVRRLTASTDSLPYCLVRWSEGETNPVNLRGCL